MSFVTCNTSVKFVSEIPCAAVLPDVWILVFWGVFRFIFCHFVVVPLILFLYHLIRMILAPINTLIQRRRLLTRKPISTLNFFRKLKILSPIGINFFIIIMYHLLFRFPSTILLGLLLCILVIRLYAFIHRFIFSHDWRLSYFCSRCGWLLLLLWLDWLIGTLG